MFITKRILTHQPMIQVIKNKYSGTQFQLRLCFLIDWGGKSKYLEKENENTKNDWRWESSWVSWQYWYWLVEARLIPFIGIWTKRQTLSIPLWKPKRLGVLALTLTQQTPISILLMAINTVQKLLGIPTIFIRKCRNQPADERLSGIAIRAKKTRSVVSSFLLQSECLFSPKSYDGG